VASRLSRKAERERVNRALDLLSKLVLFPFGDKFGSRQLDPVAPEISRIADQADLLAAQGLDIVANIVTTFTKEAVNLHDLSTDLIGKVGKAAGLPFLDDLQELVDFPIERVAQAIAIIAKEVKKSNRAAIIGAKRRLKK